MILLVVDVPPKEAHLDNDLAFILAVLNHVNSFGPRRGCDGVRVLDFGCGAGRLVGGLRSAGYEASGCDIAPFWAEAPLEAACGGHGQSGSKPSLPPIEACPRTADAGAPMRSVASGAIHRKVAGHTCRVIESPYRIPFENDSFDRVISTSVFEHVRNKEEAFQEIFRVLKPGGIAIHLFPSQWYLPIEPHIHVPLVNLMWPRVPRWWLAWWALAGIRNEFQEGLPWRSVRDLNLAFCATGIDYQSMRKYRQLSLRVFGNYENLVDLYIREGAGGLSRLLRRLPLPIARPLAHGRMALIAMRKV